MSSHKFLNCYSFIRWSRSSLGLNLLHYQTIHLSCYYSATKLFPTLCDHMDYSMPDSLSFTISQSLLKLMSIESMMSCDYLILCCPLLLLPSIFPSIRVFSNESTFCIRWPKCWNFSFSISPSSEYSGLISFREIFFLAVQGTLKSLLQHHGLKASILWCSAIFMVLPSHLYMTTGSV